MTGSDKVLPSFSAGRDMSAAVASAYSASEQATSSFMNSVSSTASKSSSITGFVAKFFKFRDNAQILAIERSDD